MTDNKKTLTDQSLDEALALMAEEVPPMPADFHAKWTKAIKEEAAKTPTETKKAQTEPEKEKNSKQNSKVIAINRWTRILSVAAVFVFLIGGTLIYRSSRPKATVVLPEAEKQKTAAITEKPAPVYEDAGAVMPAAEEPAPEAAGAVYEMEAAEEEADRTVEDPAMGYHAEAPEADAAMKEANTAVEEATEAEAPMLSMSASKDAIQMDMAAGEAADTEEAAVNVKGAKNNTAATSVPEVHMTPDPTRVPEQEKEEPEAEIPEAEPEPAAETKPEPAEEAEPASFLQSIGTFLKDMGAFLLTVWPYLLILAIPVGAALIYRKKKSSKG